mgnify:CR=1 FL=1
MQEEYYNRYWREYYGIELKDYEWEEEECSCPDFYLEPEEELSF